MCPSRIVLFSWYLIWIIPLYHYLGWDSRCIPCIMYPPVLCSLLYIQFVWNTSHRLWSCCRIWNTRHSIHFWIWRSVWFSSLEFSFLKTCCVYLAVPRNISTCSMMCMMSNENLGNVRFFIEPSQILSDIQKLVTKGPGDRHEWWYSGFFIECVCDQWLYTVGSIVFFLGCGIQYCILCI